MWKEKSEPTDSEGAEEGAIKAAAGTKFKFRLTIPWSVERAIKAAARTKFKFRLTIPWSVFTDQCAVPAGC